MSEALEAVPGPEYVAMKLDVVREAGSNRVGVVVIGVTPDGDRELVACRVVDQLWVQACREVFAELRAAGVERVGGLVLDAGHLSAAIGAAALELWPGCDVRFAGGRPKGLAEVKP